MTAFLNILGLIAACVLIALWCAVSLLFSVASVLILRSFEGLAEGLASARQAFLPAVRRLASWFIRRSSWCAAWVRLRRRPLVRFVEYTRKGCVALGDRVAPALAGIAPRIDRGRAWTRETPGRHGSAFQRDRQTLYDWAGNVEIIDLDQKARIAGL